jgi:uridine kinase
MNTYVLVSGIPRAGKSSFCDAVEASGEGFTHIPLDRYVLPVPSSRTFLDWIATPACIAWDHLAAHLDLLESGESCYPPRPNWESGWRDWISVGGAIETGSGRLMKPAQIGYLIAGTHAFNFPVRHRDAMRVFVQTPEVVVAERLAGVTIDPEKANAFIRERMASNVDAILSDARTADLIIDGTAERRVQIQSFLVFRASRMSAMRG